MQNINLALDAAQWKPTGSDADKTSRLLYAPVLSINGQPFHIEAYAVKTEGKYDEQVVADPEFEVEVAALQLNADGALETQEINGRDYIISITPHGA